MFQVEIWSTRIPLEPIANPSLVVLSPQAIRRP